MPSSTSLPSFLLPFVTRSLRGGRCRRTWLLALLLGVLVTVVTSWISFGQGSFEREIRVALGRETPRWEQEHQDFKIIVDSAEHFGDLRRQRVSIEKSDPATFYRALLHQQRVGPLDYRLRSQIELALDFVSNAAYSTTPADSPSVRSLRQRARTFIEPFVYEMPEHGGYANLQMEDDRQRLTAILDQNAIPSIELYRSPLGSEDWVILLGCLSGGLLTLLFLVFGPLLVAIQQAQEVHENTLAPLLGTTMSPRQLALGLASGPMSVITLFALPQLFIFLPCVFFLGFPLASLAFLLALVAAALFAILLAQLMGQVLGAKRTPGIIGIALLTFYFCMWITGLVLALNIEDSAKLTGCLALLPSSQTLYLLRSSFSTELSAYPPHSLAQLFALTGALVYGGLGFLVLESLSKLLRGNYAPLLGRKQALLGAVGCILLVLIGLPQAGSHHLDGEELAFFYLAGLALMALPLTLLLTTRVPFGELPPTMRRIPLRSILTELAVVAGLHMVSVVASLLFVKGDHIVDPFSEVIDPGFLFYLLWSFLVLGLVVVRSVAAPSNVAGKIWTLFCGAALLGAFGQLVHIADNSWLQSSDYLVLFKISPVLGLIQVGLLLWIPWSMLRALKRAVASVGAPFTT